MTVLVAGLVGRDLETLVAFYSDVMGFAVVQRRDFDAFGTVLSLQRGDARLKLFFPLEPADAVAVVEPWYQPGGWRYAALHLDDAAAVDALAAAVDAGGGRLVLAPSEHRPGARMAVVTDPEHNTWELLYDPDVSSSSGG